MGGGRYYLADTEWNVGYGAAKHVSGRRPMFLAAASCTHGAVVSTGAAKSVAASSSLMLHSRATSTSMAGSVAGVRGHPPVPWH
jgi:hypothetical protein